MITNKQDDTVDSCYYSRLLFWVFLYLLAFLIVLFSLVYVAANVRFGAFAFIQFFVGLVIGISFWKTDSQSVKFRILQIFSSRFFLYVPCFSRLQDIFYVTAHLPLKDKKEYAPCVLICVQ